MKNLCLLACWLFICVLTNAQNCAQLVYPANGQTMVELKYDAAVSVPSGKSNGVELKWRSGFGYGFVYVKAPGGTFELVQYPGGFGEERTSDTSLLFPASYNTGYEWYVTNQPSGTCQAQNVFSFTTGPPPVYCKPGCGNVYNYDFYAFLTLIKGSNSIDNIYTGFACQQYNSAGSTVPELQVGKTYAASFWYEFQTPFSAWIDFNDNGYYEANEQLMSLLRPYQPRNYYDFNTRTNGSCASLYIPATAQLGQHRIRIISNGDEPCVSAASMADGFIKIIASDNSNYDLAGITPVNTCVTITNTSISSKTNNNNEWVPLVDQLDHLVAAVNANGNNLGTVTVVAYENSGPIRSLPNNTKVLDRSIAITPQFQPVTPVDVRLYFSQAEFDALKAADPSITSVASINISKFSSGCGQALTGYNFIGQTSSGTINGYYYIQFSTTSFSDFYLRGGVDPGLPVHFLSAAVKREGKDVRVIWQTATEQNNKGFEVEYSADGSNFKTLSFIATKANAGNSNAAIAYSFSDLNAPAQVGFYRIKQIDKDGKILYSNILGISAVAGGRLFIARIFPNPTRNNIQVQVNAVSNEAVILELVNSAGVSVLQRQVSLQPGQNSTTISLESVPTGIYLLHLKDKDGRKLAQAKVSRL